MTQYKIVRQSSGTYEGYYRIEAHVGRERFIWPDACISPQHALRVLATGLKLDLEWAI